MKKMTRFPIGVHGSWGWGWMIKNSRAGLGWVGLVWVGLGLGEVDVCLKRTVAVLY